MKTFVWIVLGAALSFAQTPVIDEATRAALANRVGESQKTVGIAAGLVTPEGRAYAFDGAVLKGGAAPTKDTLFEIGSITKVFTALLLADMVERGEAALDDPVAKFLPESVKVPSRNGRQITLADLVTHTSGLPRIPSNLDPTNLTNPYADYDAAKLYEFLSGYTLPRDPGEQWEYSNLGAGLLGHSLARHAGMSYEQLVTSRILKPLGMESTAITLLASQRENVATAYDEGLNAVPLWDFDALAGAGAIRSTLDDMLTFAAANTGIIDTPLRDAMEQMRSFRRPGPSPQVEQAMGWLILKPMGTEAFLHDGGTHGFRSAITIDPANKRGAVAWANSPLPVTDLTAHLVEPRSPLPTFDTARTGAQLPESTLESYVGVYEIAPAFSLTVTRQGPRLFVQGTGQPQIEVFAEKEDEFFARAVDAQISFVKDESGAVNGLVLHQNGQNTPAKKIQ